jgi:two-component system LytT family sensor kinase
MMVQDADHGCARIPLWALLAIATAFGLSSTAQAYLLARISGEPPAPLLLFNLTVLNLVYWYVPALLAPIIMTLAVRPELRRRAWPIQVIAHVAGALAYSVIHTAIMQLARHVMRPWGGHQPSVTWWQFAEQEYLMQLDWLLMSYLFLVGLAHALVYRRQAEARALNAAHLETRLVEAQLQALQRQLHPHFLFNTLNTISGLVRVDPRAADLMIARLGDLLRTTLRSSGTQEVSLKEELEVLQKYVDIEQTRFGDRLQVSMEIEPDTLDALVPNLLLQPLVENAIRHGIVPKARPGWIRVNASRSGGELTLRVCDSGDGVPSDRLAALNGGVGLTNTRARLEHLYRAAHRFVFTNEPIGFCVTIQIPYQIESREAVHAGVA